MLEKKKVSVRGFCCIFMYPSPVPHSPPAQQQPHKQHPMVPVWVLSTGGNKMDLVLKNFGYFDLSGCSLKNWLR